jgi:hypothetical protein
MIALKILITLGNGRSHGPRGALLAFRSNYLNQRSVAESTYFERIDLERFRKPVETAVDGLAARRKSA